VIDKDKAELLLRGAALIRPVDRVSAQRNDDGVHFQGLPAVDYWSDHKTRA
jgi:hypothetical protein